MTNEIPVTSTNKEISKDERNWATITHLSALAGIIFPIFTVVAPLIVWLVKKQDMPFVDDQGKEALNFQITMLIGFVICIPLMIIVIGFLLAFVLSVTDLVLIIIAAANASKGEYYRYPFALRLIK